MLATLGSRPHDSTDFAVEAKYDGQCGMAVFDGSSVTLLRRNGADITRTFPKITPRNANHSVRAERDS